MVEFGTRLAGPLLGKHLVGFGCEVVAVRPPRGEEEGRGETDKEERGGTNRGMREDLEHGKRVVEMSLPSPAAMELVREADVLIENLAPGRMKGLGLDAETCWREANPDLLYVSLPGFAEGDAEFEGVEEWDDVVMAAAGVFCDMGLNRTLRGVEASYSALPLASAYASVFGAFAVGEALQQGRKGERIEVPMGSALAEAMVHNSMSFPLDARYASARKQAVDAGRYPIAPDALDALLDPFFAKYECADGRTVYLVCPAHARHQRAAMRALGVEEEVEALGVQQVDPYDEEGAHGIGAGRLSAEQAEAVRPVLRRAFSTRTSLAWEAALGAAGVPAIAHRTTEEWTRSAHARLSGLVTPAGKREEEEEGEGARGGEEKRREGEEEVEERVRLAPLGWIREEGGRKGRAGKRDGGVDATTKKKGGKTRLKVVDLTNVIAGPTIGAMLARAGAEVIKVDPPRPTYAPEIAVVYGLAANVGKRSALVDVCCPSGRKVLDALLREADVLIVNCTSAALRRLRLSPDDLFLLNPSLVLVRFDAWGGPREAGPFDAFVGYDDNVQAAIGIMARFGGSLEDAEEHAHIGTIDVVAGVAGAAAALFALVRRREREEEEREEEEQAVTVARTSLAAVGQYLQYPFMHGVRLPTCGTGSECVGQHALRRLYPARDGWIMLTACADASEVPGAWPRVRSALGMGEEEVEEGAERRSEKRSEIKGSETGSAGSFPFPSVQRELGSALAGRGVHASAERLRAAGLSAVPLCSLASLRTRCKVERYDPSGKTFQFVTHADHPVGALTMVAPCAVRRRGGPGGRPGGSLRSESGAPSSSSSTPPPLHPPPSLSFAPKYGAHTLEVLAEARQTKALLLGAASTGWSRSYVPFSTPCGACSARRRLVVLACGHPLCYACLSGMQASHTCPTCMEAHRLDPFAMRAAAEEWKGAYARWRRGGARGASGEHGACRGGGAEQALLPRAASEPARLWCAVSPYGAKPPSKPPLPSNP